MKDTYTDETIRACLFSRTEAFDNGRFIVPNGHDEVPSDTLSASVLPTSTLKRQ
ncbi:hypothetical protein M422DRAFT_269638 [Sphaerobolus stellatus SS14]|uniref:Uncharacterized protein n=1 Tax=Sphaerobolus stellatus (strain SS14) TaxID=990650 RepID=A0A0C9UUM2_SPHS4|nr:hypothetical protein M422DRAFT_269638 [Sphaerobolus stellatus SS14]